MESGPRSSRCGLIVTSDLDDVVAEVAPLAAVVAVLVAVVASEPTRAVAHSAAPRVVNIVSPEDRGGARRAGSSYPW